MNRKLKSFVVFNKIRKQFQIGVILSNDFAKVIYDTGNNWISKENLDIIREGNKLNENEMRCNKYLMEVAMNNLENKEIEHAFEKFGFSIDNKERQTKISNR